MTTTDLRQFEVLDEIKSVLNTIANWMAIPLFTIFWVADLIYVPEQKWIFLFLRLTIIPVCYFVKKSILETQNYKKAQIIGTVYAVSVALPINIMIFLISDPSTGYYAGLNLVAFGGLSFIPFSTLFFVITSAGIYLPYFAIVLLKCQNLNDYSRVAINSFFIVGSIVICFLIRYFNENLRVREINSRLALKLEIANRDYIIKSKTEEAVRLHSLSNQFSPQVVRAIRDGKVDLEKGVHRSKICAIFVDIVGSTERVVRLDQSKVDLVLSRFMDTVVSIFLKYDLTIDKFQGDGLLAFANDPVQHGDFIQRTCSAAIEVRTQLMADREFYLMNWKKELQIRIGISAGYANVGFYGNKKFFRSYTAIGAPLPFASRLTNIAEPNQILVDSDIAMLLIEDNYELKKLGEYSIKGFEADQHIIFELMKMPVAQMNYPIFHTQVCPKCQHEVLNLEMNSFGQFVMKCEQCGFELEENTAQMNIVNARA
jgi:class 3 adenylate cyclase